MSTKAPSGIDKALVRRHFGRAARSYDAHALLQHQVGDGLRERLQLLRLQPEWIVDLGAGTGRQARQLNRDFPNSRLLLMDLAGPMLLEARRQKRWRQRQHFVQGDAEHLPLRGQSVDLLFSNLALQWVEDLEATLAELRRVLRPGGLLMFSTLGPDTLQELRAAFQTIDGHAHVNPFWDLHDVGDALLHQGFADPVVDVEHYELTYSTLDDLLRDLRQIGANNALRGRRSGLWTPRGLQRLRTAYESWRSPEGRLPAHYEVVYAHAWVTESRSPTATEIQPLRFHPRGPRS